MNELKIKWFVAGDTALCVLWLMSFTVKADKKTGDNGCAYLVESDPKAGYPAPLFVEIKAAGIHCAKKRAESVIIDFICSELKKANEDE